MKSFQPQDRPPGERQGGGGKPAAAGCNSERDFRGEKGSKAIHHSRADPAARLYRKAAGQPAKLCYLGHLLMENRNGLIVDAELTQATGWASGRRSAIVPEWCLQPNPEPVDDRQPQQIS